MSCLDDLDHFAISFGDDGETLLNIDTRFRVDEVRAALETQGIYGTMDPDELTLIFWGDVVEQIKRFLEDEYGARVVLYSGDPTDHYCNSL